MTSTRRHFFISLAAAAPGAAATTSSTQPWRQILASARRSSFGMVHGRAKDPASLFKMNSPGGAPLSFDVSNNYILCSLNANGQPERLCIAHGAEPLPYEQLQGGVYSRKLLEYGSPAPLLVEVDGQAVNGRPADQIELLDNAVPLFLWRRRDLVLTQIAFAPADGAQLIRLGYLLENLGNAPVRALFNENAIVVNPGSTHFHAGIASVQPQLRPAPFWADLQAVLDRQRSCYGRLTIPGAPIYGDLVQRYAETARQSVLLNAQGGFCGGFLGSDVDKRDFTWNRDTLYALLGAGVFHPELLAKAVPFFMKYNVPERPTARGLARFPNGTRVTQSVGNAVAPLAMAATHYRFTGAASFEGLMEFASKLIDDLLATRRGEPMLFPSMFISNGDARGHFHTGSNVLAWYAISGMGRIAREVFKDEERASKWCAIAARMKTDIEQCCTGAGPLGRQYFEGVYEDHMFVPGHDGEESDTNLMPFYGFCERNEPLLRHHAKLALTPLNPYFAPGPRGIWWHNHGGFRPATMPAWIAQLTAAANANETLAALGRFRELTDFDGSPWWWPYRHGESDVRNVARGNGAAKCAWASGVFVMRFLHGILGIGYDAPSRTLRLDPVSPWGSFEWQGMRLGTGSFDLRYTQGAWHVKNRNPHAIQVAIAKRPAVSLAPEG